MDIHESTSLTSKTIRGGAAIRYTRICYTSLGLLPPVARHWLRGSDAANTKLPDCRCDFSGVRLQREVPGVEEADIGVRNIALERFGSRGQEERIVLAPHRQQRRLAISEIGVEVRVESDIAGIVEQQIELRLMRSRAC